MKKLALVLLAALSLPAAALAEQGRPMTPANAQQEQMNRAGNRMGGMELDIDTIERVQQQLNLFGFDAGHVDGIVGEETTDALRNFQQWQGLQVSGEIDAATLSALGIVFGPSSASAERSTTGSAPSERSYRAAPEAGYE